VPDIQYRALRAKCRPRSTIIQRFRTVMVVISTPDTAVFFKWRLMFDCHPQKSESTPGQRVHPASRYLGIGGRTAAIFDPAGRSPARPAPRQARGQVFDGKFRTANGSRPFAAPARNPRIENVPRMGRDIVLHALARERCSSLGAVADTQLCAR